MAKYGLIGKTLGHSFSKTFFTLKFEKEERDDSYHNFEIKDASLLSTFLDTHKNVAGFNVTMPYKQAIMPLLDSVEKEAKEIGAVNTIRISASGKLVGHNTDHIGFALALASFLPLKEKTALILGTGGSSKAIAFVLKTMNFDYKFVSRNPKADNHVSYDNLNYSVMSSRFLIINCTPLGTFPAVNECPDIPYNLLTSDHVLFDLVYNPKETEFLKRGFGKGARVTNGLKMLEYQAKKSWDIWQKK